MKTKLRQIDSLLMFDMEARIDTLTPSPGNVFWPLCYCYDDFTRLGQSIVLIISNKKSNQKPFVSFMSLSLIWRMYWGFNRTLISLEGPSTSELWPGEVTGWMKPNEQSWAQLNGVWVLQTAAITFCSQGGLTSKLGVPCAGYFSIII